MPKKDASIMTDNDRWDLCRNLMYAKRLRNNIYVYKMRTPKSRAWEPEWGVFGSLEPSRSRLKKNRSRSRLEKKSGAGAAKK